MVTSRTEDEFEQFVIEMRPRLVRAFVGYCGVDRAADAASEALAYALENWKRVRTMENPGGYLYRVGQSRSRPRKQGYLPEPGVLGVPEVEPGLVPALMGLPETQRTAVWLVHACGWTYREAAEALDTSESMIGNHVSRGLGTLRRELGVGTHA